MISDARSRASNPSTAYLVFWGSLVDDFCHKSVQEALDLEEEAGTISLLEDLPIIILVIFVCVVCRFVAALLYGLSGLSADGVDDVEAAELVGGFGLLVSLEERRYDVRVVLQSQVRCDQREKRERGAR